MSTVSVAGDVTTSGAKVSAAGDVTSGAKISVAGDVTSGAKISVAGDATNGNNIISNARHLPRATAPRTKPICPMAFADEGFFDDCETFCRESNCEGIFNFTGVDIVKHRLERLPMLTQAKAAETFVTLQYFGFGLPPAPSQTYH